MACELVLLTVHRAWVRWIIFPPTFNQTVQFGMETVECAEVENEEVSTC